MPDDSYTYSPDEIDRTLRSWSAWSSRAEGIGSSVPDAHRSGKGHRYDPLVHADRCADVERALAALEPGSLGWRIADKVRYGFSVGRLALVFGVRKHDALIAYDQACILMACYLGWIQPREPE